MKEEILNNKEFRSMMNRFFKNPNMTPTILVDELISDKTVIKMNSVNAKFEGAGATVIQNEKDREANNIRRKAKIEAEKADDARKAEEKYQADIRRMNEEAKKRQAAQAKINKK